MQAIRVERQIGGRTLSIETGSYAKLADGSVTVQYGDTVVFGFRPQIFVTRAHTCGVAGIAGGNPAVGAIYDALGRAAEWPL